MDDKRLFVDTWGWLVLANERDPAFGRVSRMRASAAGQSEAWVTTDYVLDEALTRLFAATPFARACRFSGGIFEASRQGLLDIEHVTPERFSLTWRLRRRYHDKQRISFTDLTSFAVMHELGLRRVLIGGAHFEQAGMGFVCLP